MKKGSEKTLNIREIREEDNTALFAVIATVMEDFITCGNGEGTILTDPTAKAMAACYQEDRAIYYVAFLDDQLVGGGGIRQLTGADQEYCELQRLFLLKTSRGIGLGNQLMQLCMDKAKEFGYRYCYLETLENMHAAQKLYEKWDFNLVDQPMGNTGHGGCDVWMLKEFSELK